MDSVYLICNVYYLDDMLNKHIGEQSTPERNTFESELRLDLLGEMIKRAKIN